MTDQPRHRASESFVATMTSQLTLADLAAAPRRVVSRGCAAWSAPITLQDISGFAAPFVGERLVPGRRLAIAQRSGYTYVVLGDALLGRFPNDVEVSGTAAVRVAHAACGRDGHLELTVRMRAKS